MEEILFADTLKKIGQGMLKIPTVIIDDPIFRLHYRATGVTLFFSSILVSWYQFFGQPIMCIQKDDIPIKLLNAYCWVEGTFTLPKALTKIVGTEVIYPGVEKYQHGDEVIEHAYYQWVSFVLILQSLLFYMPHVIWKALENGRMNILIQKMRNPILDKDKKELHYGKLACYFRTRRYQHRQYAFRFLFCEVLNFINVIGQIYFLDKFFGGQFRIYGAEAVRFANEDQENRSDPMIKTFPRITKCTFHKYGSSGDVQKHDALCLLPLNILNEKLFLGIWFWLVILSILGGLLLIYRIFTILSHQVRFVLLNCASRLIPMKKLKSLLPKLSYGDWFVLYLLADNIDNVHFRDFLLELEKKNINCFQQDIPNESLEKDEKKAVIEVNI